MKLFIKGALKLYFMYYLRVVSVLFSTGLYKCAFSTYSFGKTRFSSFVCLYLWVLIFSFPLCFEFNVFLKNLKSDSNLPKEVCIFCFIERPLKMMKNVFYFILKALSILKMFKFLSWLFGHVEKMAWLER